MLKQLVLAALVATVGAACAVSPEALRHADHSSVTSSNCLTTGTRIHLKAGDCSAVSGRSYSREDLERMGALTTAEALQRLDPSLW